MTVLRMIVGLGNPTRRYEGTRHNAGYWFLDAIAQRRSLVFSSDGRFQGDVATFEWCGAPVRLLKPTTFMNRSGQSVGALARYYRIAPESILVAHDELDFDPGVVRFKRAGGHGGHNGLKDVIAHLGSREFCRVRIGIGRPQESRDVVGFVLAKPSVEERRRIGAAIERALDGLPDLLDGRVDDYMNLVHSG